MPRWAKPEDAAALGEVFHRAIREGESPYTEAQRKAWSPEFRSVETWVSRLADQEAVLDETGDRITGFMSLDREGYIDLAFILPEARGTGQFRRLYNCVEARARELGLGRLYTHASLMAEPAFRSMGFRVIQRQKIRLAGQVLARARMEKLLG